tara:strand:- start:1454 stop:1963 length:510 start_codon:yes stop_codon:yes gene_type:complete
MILQSITIPRISALLVPFAFFAGTFVNEDKKEEVHLDENTVEVVDTVTVVDSTLIHALINVESRGDSNCLGDLHLGSPSVGVLQIRPIMVREINRILKIQDSKVRYKKKDRFSREKSIEMFYIWKNFHHKDDSDEVIARCWNGGPKGWKRIKTQHYWNKVQKELKEIRG